MESTKSKANSKSKKKSYKKNYESKHRECEDINCDGHDEEKELDGQFCISISSRSRTPCESRITNRASSS